MDFFIGVMASLVSLLVFNKMIKNNSKDTSLRLVPPIHSQSFIYDSIGPLGHMVNNMYGDTRLNTQATKHFESLHVTVAFSNNNAYWIENNSLFCAALEESGFDKNSGKRVDTMGMSSVELNEIQFIVEQLTKAGNYDNGNPGDKKLR
jgi:hypothetical protein